MKQEILKILRESTGYVSGQKLCDVIGVSRSGIWKAINKLKEEGYEIDAVKTKGYCLRIVPDILTVYEIKDVLNSSWIGKNLECHNEIDSTNIKARILAEAGCPNGQLVVSDIQTQGKGRRGRTWLSEVGSMICMSMVLRSSIPIDRVSAITLVAALAVSEALRDLTKESNVQVKIKWPNDIIISGKKVCGILTEMSCDMEGVKYVVVGIGVNVNTKSFPKELDEIATSIYNETGKMLKRSLVVAKIIEIFEKYYEIFENDRSFEKLKLLYEEQMINKNKKVKVLGIREEFEGIAKGIDDNGELLVETESGEIRGVVSGEVSVRGIYGYV